MSGPQPHQQDPRQTHGHPPQPYPPQPYPNQPYPPQPYPNQPYPGQGFHTAHNQPPPYAQGPPLFQMRLTEHTGMVLMWSQRSYTVVGTIEQCEAYFQRAQSHCLGAGWWSIASVLLFNWLALSSNRRAIKSARTQWSALAHGYPPQPR